MKLRRHRAAPRGKCKFPRLKVISLENRDLPCTDFLTGGEEQIVGPLVAISGGAATPGHDHESDASELHHHSGEEIETVAGGTVARRAPGPDDHGSPTQVGDLKADPSMIAMGPFLQPSGGGFQLFDGGNVGPAYAPWPITYSTNAVGLPQLNSAPSSPVAIYL